MCRRHLLRRQCRSGPSRRFSVAGKDRFTYAYTYTYTYTYDSDDYWQH